MFKFFTKINRDGSSRGNNSQIQHFIHCLWIDITEQQREDAKIKHGSGESDS